jgi:ADP-ribose pyrophosphatase YjhB (NUDIX family)
MKLKVYKKLVTYPLRNATLLFLVKEDEILLAMKKKGFGQGMWNGVGGKVEDHESIEEAAVRETKEEIDVAVAKICQVATLDFYFPLVPQDKKWNQQVHVFFATKWEGIPKESEEMAPKWYSKKRLPYKKMWPDDIQWLPFVLQDRFVTAEFAFGDKNKILDFALTEKDFK